MKENTGAAWEGSRRTASSRESSIGNVRRGRGWNAQRGGWRWRLVDDRYLAPESTVEELRRLKRKDMSLGYFKGHTEFNGDEKLWYKALPGKCWLLRWLRYKAWLDWFFKEMICKPLPLCYLGLLNRTYNGSCQASCPLRHWFINFISKSNAMLWLQIQIIQKNETAFLTNAIWVCVSSSKCLFKILILFSYWLLSLTGYLGHLSSRIYGFTLLFLIVFFFLAMPCSF